MVKISEGEDRPTLEHVVKGADDIQHAALVAISALLSEKEGVRRYSDVEMVLGLTKACVTLLRGAAEKHGAAYSKLAQAEASAVLSAFLPVVLPPGITAVWEQLVVLISTAGVMAVNEATGVGKQK